MYYLEAQNGLLTCRVDSYGLLSPSQKAFTYIKVSIQQSAPRRPSASIKFDPSERHSAIALDHLVTVCTHVCICKRVSDNGNFRST